MKSMKFGLHEAQIKTVLETKINTWDGLNLLVLKYSEVAKFSKVK